MTDLHIDFIGSLTDLRPGDQLSFGREAELVIDENPYLHRKLGLVHSRGEAWWLTNTGTRIPLEVRDLESRSVLVVASGREVAITFPSSVVQFEAGGSKYELSLTLDPTAEVPDDVGYLGDEGDSCATISLDQLPLTDDQKRVLLVLCEAPLRNPAADIDIPPSRVGAQRLGWTLKAYGRKLDNICDRLTRTGVRGLRGDQAGIAKDRRSVLADYALSSRLVTSEDLVLLDHHHQ